MSATDYSAPIALSLQLISWLAGYYRNNHSAIGRVERMEEEAEETKRSHCELVDVHLPSLPPNPPEGPRAHKIDVDNVRDWGDDIRIVSAQIRLLKAEVKRASLLKQLHWRYEREPEEESMEAIGERLDFLTKDTLNTTAVAIEYVDAGEKFVRADWKITEGEKDRAQRRKARQGKTEDKKKKRSNGEAPLPAPMQRMVGGSGSS